LPALASRLRSVNRSRTALLSTGIVVAIILLSVILIDTTDSGRDSVKAVIEVDSNEMIVGLVAQFYGNKSMGDIDTYDWDFGDGNTSQEMNPRHRYFTVGVYDVILRVTDASGKTARANSTVSVQHWDVYLEETLGRRATARAGKGNIFTPEIGPNIGSPNAHVNLRITLLVGIASIEIRAEVGADPDHINDPAMTVDIHQEQFTSTGQNIEFSYDIEADRIPAEAATSYSVLAIVIMLHSGYWTEASLNVDVDFPMNDLW
jgi:PKD repeat protein